MANPILTFKSNLPNLTVLTISTQDIEQLKAGVRKKIRQAPMMFIGMQVVIDLSDFDKENSLTLDLAAFKDFLMGESINPVAIMSNSRDTQRQAVEYGLGALAPLAATNSTAQSTPSHNSQSTRKKATVTEKTPQIDKTAISSEEPRKTFDAPTTNEETNKHLSSQSRTVRHTVRSGQSIYTQGDLTIIGSVSAGAEVIADGNIHIYGTLRGRAIAGAQGDTTANIFCQQLDAELVAIAGSYTQMEDIGNEYHGKTVQISLESEKICFFPL